MKNTIKLLIALVIAIGLGIFTSFTKNPILLNLAKWVEAVGTIWISFLRMTIFPLVMALLVTSITGMSNKNKIGALIKKTGIVFLALNVLMIVVTLLVVPPLLKLIPSSVNVPPGLKSEVDATISEPLSLMNELLSWIPLNPFKSAADGAIMPVIVFSVFLGLALRHVGDIPRNTIVQFFSGVADAMMVIVKWLFVVAPVGIFTVVFPLICQMGTGLVGALAYYVLITVINVIACMIILYGTIFFFTRHSVQRFAAASLQPQIILIGTMSSVATLPAMVKAAESDLKISPQITKSVLPLAVSVFRAGSVGGLIIYALFTAHLYHINFSPSQMATVVVISFLANVASIGLPSAASFFAPITTLFQATGLPFGMMAVLFAVDTIPDVTQGIVNVTGDMAAVAIVDNFSGEITRSEMGIKI